MQLIIDTSNVAFTVGRAVEPRKDANGQQRQDRNTHLPMWTVQLVAVDAGGAEVINVTYVAAEPPKVTVGQAVVPESLQALPWAQNGRNGVAFRATGFKPVTAGKGSVSS